MRKISIIGIGETPFGKLADRSLTSLMQEGGNKALADAGIQPKNIQALFMANFNASALCGQSHLGPMASEALGLGMIPTIRVEGACASGSLAFRQACMAVAGGFYDLVLVGGVEKMTHQKSDVVTGAIASASDAALEASCGVTFPSVFAMLAHAYGHKFVNPREAMSLCAMQNHENACLNPDAQMKKRVSREDVESSMPVADPLTIMDCSLVTDGACFVVVADEATARRIQEKRRVNLLGAGHAGDALSLAGKSSLTTLKVCREAARQAYSQAGLTPRDMDLAEVHDCFTITQILNCEDLGFFEKGRGTREILKGRTARTGDIPINTSGGLKAKGHPIGATGLSQIYEVVTQLRQEAGERQVPARVGLAHNLGGTAATCLVHIFSREAS